MKARPFKYKPPCMKKFEWKVRFDMNSRDMQQALLELQSLDNLENLHALRLIKNMLEYYERIGVFKMTGEFQPPEPKNN